MKHSVSKFTPEVDLETIDTTVLRDIISAYKANLTDKVIEYTLCLRLNSATLFNNIYLGLLTIHPSEIDTGEIVDILNNLKNIEWQHENRILGNGITFDAFDPYECDDGCICSNVGSLASKWYDCSIGGCPANPCNGKIYSMRDAHNCKVKSSGKHYGCPKTGKCYKINTALSHNMKGGFCCS